MALVSRARQRKKPTAREQRRAKVALRSLSFSTSRCGEQYDMGEELSRRSRDKPKTQQLVVNEGEPWFY